MGAAGWLCFIYDTTHPLRRHPTPGGFAAFFLRSGKEVILDYHNSTLRYYLNLLVRRVVVNHLP
jgi:hypothetical protein